MTLLLKERAFVFKILSLSSLGLNLAYVEMFGIIVAKRNINLTSHQKFLKLTIEDSLKGNSKGQKASTDFGRPVNEKLIINSNLFVTELVGEYN